MSGLYRPDGWVVTQFSYNGKQQERVFGSFFGGYTGSDSWRWSSGVVSCALSAGQLYFGNQSGSTYICLRERYGKLSSYTEGILQQLKEHDAISDFIVLPETTDWLTYSWSLGRTE